MIFVAVKNKTVGQVLSVRFRMLSKSEAIEDHNE